MLRSQLAFQDAVSKGHLTREPASPGEQTGVPAGSLAPKPAVGDTGNWLWNLFIGSILLPVTVR